MAINLKDICSKSVAESFNWGEVSDKKRLIFIVDDNSTIRMLLESILSIEGYETFSAANGKEALDNLAGFSSGSGCKPDLILMDIEMPVMDGYEACKEIRGMKEYDSIPIIMVTAVSDKDVIKNVLSLGANDYIAKPFESQELLARIGAHSRVKGLMEEREALYNALGEYNMTLEQLVEKRTKEIEDTQDATIIGLAKLAEYRDPETGAHLERIRNYCRLVAHELGAMEKYKDMLDKKYIELIFKSSPLHDIGKVGIPDHILLKPGKLTPEEFEIMKQHPIIGGDAIAEAEKKLRGQKVTFLTIGKEIAYCHHEKFNGTGYPHRIKGDDIPMSARIMALADVYDALTSKRVYKEAWTHEATREVIIKDSGSHFDPDVVDAFLKVESDFISIKSQYHSVEKV